MPSLRLGYPYRLMAALATGLGALLLWAVLPLDPALARIGAACCLLSGGAFVAVRGRQLGRAQKQHAGALAALGVMTSHLPLDLRARMPLVLVVGDGLAQLFDREPGVDRLVHVGDGAIWIRVDRADELAPMAVAIRQWRDGRAPDGVLLALAPALHTDEAGLEQTLRRARLAAGDASRQLGLRLPGYVAIYQRLTGGETGQASTWFGACSSRPLRQLDCLDTIVQGALDQARHVACGTSNPTWRASGLAAIVPWTRRVVVPVLTGRLLPDTPWPLHGLVWTDTGPACSDGGPWAASLRARSGVSPPSWPASPAPWPLPQPLVDSLPRRPSLSPRLHALANAIALLAGAFAIGCVAAAHNNRVMLEQMAEHLQRFAATPAEHETTRLDALNALLADRDRLESHAGDGVPLRLDFGMYRGHTVRPTLEAAIASYRVPTPPPAVVSLDSMSLFDTGKAALRSGSNRAMVGALELIRAHPDKRILVAGHTDNVGNKASNLQLSVARASAVRDWLMDASGMPAYRFAIQGYGDTRPLGDNQSEQGRARNRRVEIALIPDVPDKL
jgi:outer membrane protein OmpA-like peptidoglycan-associated protein